MHDASDSERGRGREAAGDAAEAGTPVRVWLLRGVGFLLLLAAVAIVGGIYWATNTAPGRETVASWVEEAVSGAVRGRVEVGELTGGNLLTRAELSRFAIREADGEPFLVLEDVRAEYDPVAFLRGQFVFRSVRLGRGLIVLRQDRDGSWNFERLFEDDGAAEDTAGDDTRLSLHDVRVRDGRVAVRTPYDEPAPDSVEIWRVERTPEGHPVRVIAVDSLSGRFPRLRLTHPDEPMLLDLEDVSGRARAVRQALPVRSANLRAVFRDTVRVRIGGLRIGRSALRGDGWVLPGDPPQYRFDLGADPLSFRDLQWLPVPKPGSGSGPAQLTLRSVGEELAVDVRGADLTFGDSRLRGALSLVASETPRLDTLDVRLAPLRLSLLDRILERPTEVDGYLEGPLAGAGPIDRLRLDGELSVRDTAGGAAPSRVRLRGGVSLEEPNPLHDLRLELEAFEPKWAGIVTRRPELDGRLRGSLFLDGSPEDSLAFRADVVHRTASDSVSRVRAEGRVADHGEEELRVDVELSPLALDAAEEYLPRVGLAGAVRGTLRTSGSLRRLDVTADLATARGEVAVEGRFAPAADPVTYDARIRASRVQLRDWLESAPYTRLDLSGRVQGEGTEPGDLEAEFDLDVLPSVVGGAAVDTSHLAFSVRGGRATVDSFDIRSDVGRLSGRGAFGLEEGRSGSLVVTATVPDLSSWNRWLVPGRNPVESDTTVSDLFEGFPDVGEAGGPGVEARAEGPAVDTLSGQLAGRAVVYGNVTDFSAGGTVRGDSLSYGPAGADSMTVTADLTSPRQLDSLVARAEGWGLRSGEFRLDSAEVTWTRRGPSDNDVRLHAARDTSLRVDGRGNFAWREARKEVRLRELGLRLGPQEMELEEPGTRLAWTGETLRVDTLRLSGGRGARLAADGELQRRGPSRFDLQFNNLESALAKHLFPSEVSYGGSLDGAIQVRGTGAEPEMSGFVTVSQPRLRGVQFDSLAANAEYRDGSVDFRAELRGTPDDPVLSADGTVRADLRFAGVEDRFPSDPADVFVRAENLPLRIVELATGSLEDLRGTMQGGVRITGAPGSFEYKGQLEATGMSAYVPSLGVRYSTERGGIAFRGGRASLDSLILRSSAGGRVTTTGTIGLAELSNPELDLSVAARKLRALDRREMRFALGGTASLTGSYEAPVLDADIQVSNGDVRLTTFTRGQDVVDLTDPDAFSLVDTTLVDERQLIQQMQNPFLQNLRLQAQLQVGPDLWLRSEQMDVAVTGDLRVRMQPEQEVLQVFGPLQLVRGQYRYQLEAYTRQLQITGGTIEFVGTPGVNPNLNVTAQYRTRGPNGNLVTITANVGGTLIEKTLTLSSEAQISDSDRICYLLFSAPCVTVAGPAGSGVGSGVAQAVREGVLGTVGTQLSSLLVADAWLDYASVQTGSLYGNDDGGQQQSLLSGSFLSRTEVEAGKYLGQDVFVSVVQPIGSRLPGATMEWQFRRNWTLEARTENRFGEGLATLSGDVLDTQRMWGLFLFREWGF